MPYRSSFALLLLVSLGCTRSLDLPDQPPPAHVPAITGFAPHAAFSSDQLIVYAENLDEVGNQLEFPGGFTVLADKMTDGGELRVDGGLSFVVPEGLDLRGPLLLSNTQGRSEPSDEPFAPLGVGHPNNGTPVAQLRFRHNPVGLVDREENVLMASSIFDLLVTDGKAYRRVPGRPLALIRSPTAGRGLVSVSIPGRRGMLLEVDTTDGQELVSSDETDTREQFILPPFDSSSLARTIGVDTMGNYYFSTWTVENVMGEDKLVANNRRAIPFAEVIGAAALGAQVTVIARQRQETSFSVWTVTALGETRAWAPRGDAACETPTGTQTLCQPPDGPVAVVPSATMGAPPTVVVSLKSGDLLKLNGSVPDDIGLISYAPITAMAAGLAPGKVILTKAIDGALFQYDLETKSVDWSVQLRGEPSVIDLAADIDEIAVGNRLDNAVDIVSASTGTWVGRIAFNLGVGSADRMPGGIVAPYSYDPETWLDGGQPLQRMDLLMRNVGLVVSLDASSLEVLGHIVLDSDVNTGAPLRLAVTDGLQTLVVHTHRLGLLEGDDSARVERIVSQSFVEAPIDVLVLPQGQVVLSWYDVVRWYEWVGTPRQLRLGGELHLPTGTTLMEAAADGEDVLVIWRTPSGFFSGGLYSLADFPTGNQRRPFIFDADPSEFLGLASMRDGPMAFFLSGDEPVVFDRTALRTGSGHASSVLNRKRVAGTSPDGRFVIWLDEGSAEPMARLVKSDDDGNIVGYSTYRLAGNAAGPACDPSGQWLYVPVPLLDQLEVVQ